MVYFFLFLIASIDAVYTIWDLLDDYLDLGREFLLGWFLGIGIVGLCRVHKKVIEYIVFLFFSFVRKGNLGFLQENLVCRMYIVT